MPAIATARSAAVSRKTSGAAPQSARDRTSAAQPRSEAATTARRGDKSYSSGKNMPSEGREKPEAKILHQNYFKSVGPRTYAAQVKEASNGNHFLVLTEGKRDEKTDELRKNRLFVFSEDFPAFFRMLHETAQFIRANPVPPEIKQRQAKFWAKRNKSAVSPITKEDNRS